MDAAVVGPMLRSPRARSGALVGLFLVLFVLLVWYGTVDPNPALGNYPNQEDFAPDPGPYVDETVVVAGEVVSTDPLVIEVEYGAGERAEYRVTGYEGSVQRGQLLRAVGRLADARTIEARNGFTVPDRGLFYAWGISFLAGLWTLARILRHWRIDPESVALVPRERPLVPSSVGAADRDEEPGGDDGA